ncbi:hypothetical protein Fot_42344 [Forsythia ovata]|uniref:Uncharacterized protein n=1 Tax=Forsythia ovata TaxID=205694 RepID=A0ABD1RME7_9LAMI
MLPEKEQRAAAARCPNLPLISPPISFQNRSSRRSNTRDFEWNQTTLRKTRKTKGSERREKKGQRATVTKRTSERPPTETGAASGWQQKYSERAELPDKKGELALHRKGTASRRFLSQVALHSKQQRPAKFLRRALAGGD